MDAAESPSDTRRPSVIDPVSSALDWTGKILFRPFDIGKWFTLGFCAWLAWLGQGGGGGGGSQWNIPGDDAGYGTEAARDWFHEYFGVIVVIGGLALLLIVGLIVLFTWLSSRGKLMFLDGVVHDRGAVTEPWHRFRERGNSLFGFRIVVGLCAGVTFGILVAVLLLGLLSLGFDNHDPGALAITAVIFWILVAAVVAIAFGLVAMATNDFIVPIMWLRNCRVMQAWSEFRGLLAANTGIFVGYVLFKFVLGFCILMIACVATCLTCCLAALPYLGTVLLLPLHVFRRSYSIHFLSRFGPDYAALGPVDGPQPGEPTPEASEPF